MPVQSVEQKILEIAQAFTSELRRLHQKMDWRKYHSTQIRLVVHFSEDKQSFSLKWSDYPVEVEGASLVTVMDEVYRRLDFEHREKGRIAASLLSLPDPETELLRAAEDLKKALDDEIPF